MAFGIYSNMISEKLSEFRIHHTIKTVIRIYGAYTLDYLVISNVVIFAIRCTFGKTLFGYHSFVVIVLLFALCY